MIRIRNTLCPLKRVEYFELYPTMTIIFIVQEIFLLILYILSDIIL